VPEENLPGYLDEFMWRRIVEKETVVDCFKRMLKDLGLYSKRSDFQI